jgi:hypothetical protein
VGRAHHDFVSPVKSMTDTPTLTYASTHAPHQPSMYGEGAAPTL